METQLEQLAEEIRLLQRCINDLLVTLPADRGGGESAEIVGALTRVADELDVYAAQRKGELAAADEALKKEVAERRRAEAALRESESEQRFRAIFDEAGTGITLVDLQQPGAPIQNNRALQKMLGLSQEELGLFETYDELTAEDDREADAATFRELCEGRRDSLRQEKHFILRDGGSVWANVIFTLLRDSAGLPRFVIAIHEDITERKRSEEDLRRSEAFLTEAQHLSSTGSFSWRVATDEITWSEQLYRIYELEVGVPVTLELIRTRVHTEDLTLYEKMVEQARNGGDDFEWQYRLLMPDRSIKYLHAVARAARDQDGGLEYIAAVQDVTERRLSEEALGKLRSELAHVSRVATLGALTASIAHEVNQPLAGIVTNAGTCLRMLAADPPNVDGARETARRTIRDGHRAADVITRLRALFGKKGAATEPVDLNEATREVIALSLSELQGSRVIMRTELADGLPPVTGDRVQLQQVILNLLRNASDAMSGVEDRPRHLLIRTERDEGECVRLSVRDAGVGLDPQAADRLFEAFYTTKNDGMGIGLSVSRSIVESHQGRLWASPNDGPGATFSFSIPRASAAVTDAPGVGAVPTPAVMDAERVVRDS